MILSKTISNENERYNDTNIAIFVYFFFLLFEGALRRWILPGYSDILFLIRDPIAIYIIYTAWKNKQTWINSYVILMFLLTVVSFYSAIFVGHGNILTAMFGLRITILHFPLIFIIGQSFKRKDIILVVQILTILCIPMLGLIILQFYSPQSAFVNIGIGGGLSEGFSGVSGYFRPPGTFSFTNGLVLFYTISLSFVLWGIHYDIGLPKWLQYLSLICVFLSIPFSISRALLIGLCITMVFYSILFIKKYLNYKNIFTILTIFFVSVFLQFNIDVFATSIDIFISRFNAANEAEGGDIIDVINNRYLGGIFYAINSLESVPFWGYGLGIGTIAGSKLAIDKIIFVISEGEWGRIIGETGTLLGLGQIFLRIGVGFKMLVQTILQFFNNNFLPWLMIGNTLIIISQSQWGQPTSLGFSVFFGGVLLASINDK
jgi:hypothetical protein